MASIYKETLQNIENGRKLCIKNAKLANLPAANNMGFNDIAELFLQQNNTEFVNPNATWHRPESWIDTKSILENAEVKDGLYPGYILLLKDTDVSTTFSKTKSNEAMQGDGYLTSDGVWYTQTEVTHTWDVTKDIETDEEYKLRWVIVYVADKDTLDVIDLSNFKCLELIIGDITIANDALVFGNKDLTKSNRWIYNVESTNDTRITALTKSAFQQCQNLRNVNLPTLIRLENGTTTGYGIFKTCYSLTSVSMPALTTISGNGSFQSCYSLTSVSMPVLTTISGNEHFNFCYSLVNVTMPNLTTISGGSTFSNCNSLTNVSMPALKTISSGSSSSANTFSSCYSLISVSMSSLTTINGSGVFSNCRSLTHIFLPNLTEINGGSNFSSCYSLTSILLPSLIKISNSMNFQECSSLIDISLPALTTITAIQTFSKCYSLTSVSMPALTTIGSGNTFLDCYSLRKFEILSTMTDISKSVATMFKNNFNLNTVILYSDWNISGLYLSDSNLRYSCIINMFNKLADVTEDTENTYTLVIGPDNLLKVTDDEVAIATDKGWVIS